MANPPIYALVPELANHRDPQLVSFTTIPDWVLFHEDLGKNDIAVYIALSSHADNVTGQCHPGQKLLMREARITDRRALWHALSRLSAIGAITVEQREGQNNVYTLLDRCLSTGDGGANGAV